MRIIILQHIKIEDPGFIKDLMIKDGAELTTIELDEGLAKRRHNSQTVITNRKKNTNSRQTQQNFVKIWLVGWLCEHWPTPPPSPSPP